MLLSCRETHTEVKSALSYARRSWGYGSLLLPGGPGSCIEMSIRIRPSQALFMADSLDTIPQYGRSSKKLPSPEKSSTSLVEQRKQLAGLNPPCAMNEDAPWATCPDRWRL